MLKDNMTLVYSAIIRAKHTILTEYTDFSGNFSQIIVEIMKDVIMKFEDIPNICKAYFFYGRYALFFLKYNKVYIITMLPNVKLNNKELIFAFLYSIFDGLKSKKEIDIEKMDKMKAYSLTIFSNTFEEKIKSFNSNCNSFIKYIKNIQEFQNYEIQERNFESNIQLPVLSKEQTNTEKIPNEEDNYDNFENRNFRGGSFISYMTYDSYKDDFLNKDTMNNDNDDKNENLIKEIEIKELNQDNNESNTNMKINDTNDSMVLKKNKCCGCFII